MSRGKVIHYVIVGILVIGGILYWAMKPPTLNPMSDPLAAEAMALVQTHRAQHAPTIRQAITDRVQALAARGQGVRLGEWTVEREQGDIYLIRIWIREKVTKGWFEREYLWQVNVVKKTVVPLTVAASDLMPTDTGAGGSSTPQHPSDTKLSFRNRNPDEVSIHLDRIARDLEIRIFRSFPGPNVVPPTVPGAFHQVSVQLALA